MEGGFLGAGWILLISSTDGSGAISTCGLAAKALSSAWVGEDLQPTVAGGTSVNLAAIEFRWRWARVSCRFVARRILVSNSTQLAGEPAGHASATATFMHAAELST